MIKNHVSLTKCTLCPIYAIAFHSSNPLQSHFLLHFKACMVSIYFQCLLAFAFPNHMLMFLNTGSLSCNFVRIPWFRADKYLLVYEIRESNRNTQISKCGDRLLSEPLGRKCFAPRKKSLIEVVKYQHSKNGAV